MIQDKQTDIKVRSNIEGDRVALSVDQAAMQHIMSILTDLYSDPELAVIREYSTNALDAHIEAGNPAPIEVTTPSALSPFFKVKDYGVGLSVDEVHDIYSKYGASTKRSTNEQTGMLGLGCKSALTYASQFTVVAVKNGVRASISVSRDESGGGSMTIVDTAATDEPNGVEIVVPAKGGNQIANKCHDFFEHWQPGTVLIDGEAPVRPECLELGNGMRLEKHPGIDLIVMGGVSYPIDGAITPYSYRLVAEVPIGAVNFTPSREALHYTPKTNAVIATIRETYSEAVQAAIQAEIDAQPDRKSAMQAMFKWRRAASGPYSTALFTYKGDTIPDRFKTSGSKMRITSMRPDGSSSVYQTINAESIVDTVLWIYDYGYERFTANHKKKILKFIEDADLEVTQIILTADKPDTKWLNADMVVPWEPIKEIKLPRVVNPNGKVRVTGSFDTWFWDGISKRAQIEWNTPADDIDTTKPILWGPSHTRSHDVTQVLRHYQDATVVKVPANRLNKFKRDFPTARPYTDALKDVSDKWLASLTESQRIALWAHWNSAEDALSYFDDSKLNDPTLAKFVKACNDEDVEALIASMQNVGLYFYDLSLDYEDPFEPYPLLKGGSSVNDDTLSHAYIYINTIYGS